MRLEKSSSRPIYDVLSNPLAASVTSLCMALSAIEHEWRAIVGDRIAARTAPKALEGDVLVVAADGQAVLQDMNFKKSALVKKISAGARIELRDIRVELGMPPRTAARPPHHSKPNARLSAPQADPEAVESLACEILSMYADIPPELARTIARCRIAAS
jgi:hypothetical protein